MRSATSHTESDILSAMRGSDLVSSLALSTVVESTELDTVRTGGIRIDVFCAMASAAVSALSTRADFSATAAPCRFSCDGRSSAIALPVIAVYRANQ